MIINYAAVVAPWAAGGLVFIAVLSAVSALKAMKAMKKSPYFFMRVQAEKRFRRYSSATLLLLLLSAATAVYGVQTPTVDQTPRMALLANRKPPSEEIIKLVGRAAVIDAERQSVTEELLAASEAPAQSRSVEEQFLPDEYDQFDPIADLQDDTALGRIAFSTEVDDEYQAVAPNDLFREGKYTLYATFSYDDMVDGMSWAWVWRLDGEVVEGGNELWAYGTDGPGYIYLNPDDGFQNGRYSLDVWVNGELLTSSTATMNSAAAAAAGN